MGRPAGDGHIVLIGAMGVGKTTVGELLATEIGVPFLDSDTFLEVRTGESGSVIAARDGVERLHELELDGFLEMSDADNLCVIAPASSVVDHVQGRRVLAAAFTVWLTAPDHILAQRQKSGDHRRPVGPEAHAALRARRAPFLEEVATITLDTGNSTPVELVEDLVGRLGELGH